MNSWMKPTAKKRIIFFILVDIVVSFGTLFLAYNLRFNFDIEEVFLDNFLFIYFVLLILKIAALAYFKIYNVAWRFVSLSEVKKIFYAHMLAYGIFVAFFYLFPDMFNPFARSILIIDLFLSMLFIGLLRIAKRLLVEGGHNIHLKKTLLIGATPFAQTLMKDQREYYVSAIVDDSSMVVSSYLSNIQVGAFSDIENIIQADDISSVIITKVLNKDVLQSLLKRINTAGVYDIKVLSIDNQITKLKRVTVEDLLARHPRDLDLKTIEAFIKGKKVLITGAGGSIGSEIARQCKQLGASALTLVDSSEFNLYQIGEQLPSADLKLVSVTDKILLEKIFLELKPQIVIHAAAYKHVPICENNQEMAVRNNVLGTKNVIDVSIESEVEKLVIISTDKAVRPTNVMGATKRVTELYASNVESKNTEIVAVRFGNVLGSSGSVIPKFKQQIEKGGPVTVTHPDITRYFMLIPEACLLVLQTASIAKGGELFVLDMGEPIKIADLAKQMIRLYGKEDEIEVIFTGLRPGEKLYEELLLDESEQKTVYSSIFIATPTVYDITQLTHDIEVLLKATDKVEALQKIVPEFTRKD